MPWNYLWNLKTGDEGSREKGIAARAPILGGSRRVGEVWGKLSWTCCGGAFAKTHFARELAALLLGTLMKRLAKRRKSRRTSLEVSLAIRGGENHMNVIENASEVRKRCGAHSPGGGATSCKA